MTDPQRSETKHLRLRGRGTWRRPKPIVAEVVAGARPYLWLGHGDEHLTTMTPAEARQLAAFIEDHFGREGQP